MTDDQWRRRRDDEDDFGPPLFGDSDSTADSASEGLSFGDSDTGPLPHWTQPPTGEIPSVLAPRPADDDELDVWSSFSGSGPIPRSDDTDSTDGSGGLDEIGDLAPVFEEDEPFFDDADATMRDDSAPIRREPGRITIGTDPTDGQGTRPSGPTRRPRTGTPPRGSGARGRTPAGKTPVRTGARPAGGTSGRDMPTAVAVGLGIAVVFLAALRWRPWAAAVIVVLVLGLAAVEYFDKVREKGYQPAFVPGIMTAVAAPIAAYHYGPSSLPVVLVLGFFAAAVGFIGSPSLESNPMPNTAITTLGTTWIGLMGSFGAAMLWYGNHAGLPKIGTDTLCLVAIGVVANDVGALFVGSAVGRTPLRAWISPNKSIEGLVGGTVLTLGAMFLIGLTDRSTTWNSTGDLLLLGLVIAIAAPVGDLTESMFKRNLDVKDFGSIVKGHGGVLDRFDGFLFALPAAYLLLDYLRPWVS
jgi:phosphatidate cytidylyltransferase